MTWRIGMATAILAVAALATHAQVAFSPTVNVSNNAGNSQRPQIAVDAKGNINLVWLDSTPGNLSVFFSRSTDGGTTFSAPKQVVSSGSPQIGVAGLTVDGTGNIHVLWASVAGNVYNAFLNRSSDSGATFTAENFQTGYTGFYAFAGVAADARGGVNVVWNSSGQNPTLNFARSKDEGATFSSKTIAGGDNSDPGAAAILADTGGNINVVWTQGGGPSMPGGMMFARSSDSGQTFSSSQQITSASGQDLAVVTDASGNVYTAWSQVVATGNGEIFFSRGASAAAPAISLSSVNSGAPSVTGGNPLASTVTLSGPAAGGASVTLVSSNPGVAAVPASVTVPAGATSAPFNVITSAVASPTAVTISATMNGVTQTSTFTVIPPDLASLSLNPSSVSARSSSMGTITLTGPAPSGGVAVRLASSNANVASVPATVTVPAGATSATFTVNAAFVLCPSQATISGTLGGVRVTVDLTIVSPMNLPAMACSGPGVGRRIHPPTRFQ